MPDQLGTIKEGIRKKAAIAAKVEEQIQKKEVAKTANAEEKGKKKKRGGPLEIMIAKTYLTLMPDGHVGTSKMLFWADTLLVDNSLSEARAMKLHTSNGKTYLLVEKGGFIPAAAAKEDSEEDTDTNTGAEDTTIPDDGSSSETRPPGWHCGYQVYERVGA